MYNELNRDEFGGTQPALAVAELPEIIITADTDNGDGYETADGTNIVTEPLGVKAVEQTILSAGSERTPGEEETTERAAAIPLPDEAPPQPADNIKKPPTPPTPPTALGSPDEGSNNEPQDEATGTVEPITEAPSAPADRPLSRMSDELDLGSTSVLEQPSDSYFIASNTVYDRVFAMADGDSSPAMQADTVHYIALRDLLAPAVLQPQEASDASAENRERTIRFDQMVGDVDFADLATQAAQLQPDDVIGYFVDKLESYTNYLATGEQPDNWPEAASQGGLTDFQISKSIRPLAETVQVALDSLGEQLEDVEALTQRYQDWAQETTSLLLSEGRIGLAAPLITIMDEANTAVAMDKLQGAMTSLRESGDEADYRRVYSSVAHSLEGENLTTFIGQNQRLEAPEIPGAQREVADYGSYQVAVDKFDDQQPITVQLANGEQTQLPYANSIQRELSPFGEPTETEGWAVQHKVKYSDLDSVAKAAIEVAWEAAEGRLLRVETMPDYKRLVLKPGEEGEPSTLHTMTLRDGFRRTVDEYPDHHGYVSSVTESQIDRPVVSAQAVSSGYMVVPDRGLYAPQTTYVDSEPNFFGPGAEHANAFWISGNPRRVVQTPESIKFRKYEDAEEGEPAEARWIIMPVTYYKIEQQRPAEDTSEDRPRYGL